MTPDAEDSFLLPGTHERFLCMPTHAADLIGCEVSVVLVVGPADVLAFGAMAAHDAERRSMCCNLHHAADALHCDRQLNVMRGYAAASHCKVSLLELQGRALRLPPVVARQYVHGEESLPGHLN